MKDLHTKRTDAYKKHTTRMDDQSKYHNNKKKTLAKGPPQLDIKLKL